MSNHLSDPQNRSNTLVEPVVEPEQVRQDALRQVSADSKRISLGQRDWLSNLRSWFPRAFISATVVYFLISFLQAFYQWLYTPGYDIVALQVEQSPITLCVRYPTWLARDGVHQEGILSLRMFSPLYITPILTSTNAISVSPTMSIATDTTTSAIVVAVPTYSSAISSTIGCRLTFQQLAQETSQITSNTSSIVISATQPISGAFGLPLSFALSASSGLRFVNSQDVMYSPVVSVVYDSEASVKIAHAGLVSENVSGDFKITQALTGKRVQPITEGLSINLEDSGGMLWRKFWEIVLAPTAGALVALAAVALDDIRKQEEKLQKKKEQEDKFKSACQELIEQLKEPKQTSIPAIIQSWLKEMNTLPDDLKASLTLTDEMSKAVSIAIEKFLVCAKHDLQRFFDPKSQEIQLLVALQEFDKQKHLLSDLNFLCNKDKHNEEHQFVDPFFAGYYTNLYWPGEDKQQHLNEQIVKFFSTVVDDVSYKNILYGIFRSHNAQSEEEKTHSLLSAIANDYIKEHRKFKSDWWNQVVNLIDAIHDNERNFEEWCQLMRQEKRKDNLIRNRIKSELRSARILWPLDQITGKVIQEPDANYDFPREANNVSNAANLIIYSLLELNYQLESPDKVSAIDICERNLSTPNHHLIMGQLGAGKTWLRLYLEYYLLALREEKSMPVFYFPPVTITYYFDRSRIIESLATSICNQLFADLIIQSGYSEPNRDPWRVSRAAILPFLKYFGYNVPSEIACLAQPIPPKQRLSIESEYSQSHYRKFYKTMKEMSDQLPLSLFSASTTDVDEALNNLQRAVELVDYKTVFILVDNWEYVQDAPRNRLLSYLLEPELLYQLYKRNIFLKLFIPEIKSLSLPHFDKSHEIKRLKLLPSDNIPSLPHLQESIWDKDTYSLNLYTYR